MTKKLIRQTQQPVEAQGRYQVEITGLGHSGEGVGKYQGFTIFVPYALPDETIEVYIEEVKKNYARGKAARVIKPAADRIQPVCPVYDRCGGCQLQHLDYPAQLEVKHQVVADAVTRIGKLKDVIIYPTLGAADPWYYRNKMQVPVGKAGGIAAVGCYAAGTHTIIDNQHCYIQHQTNNLIAAQVKNLIGELGLDVYDEKTHTGLIRHVLGRVGTATGEVMVVLVTAARELPHQAEIIDRLRRNIPGLVSIVHNVNPQRTNVIMGEATKTIWGKDTIIDRLGEFSFHISARSFFQVNTAQAAVLYRQAAHYACLSGKETVLDVYCGTGTITLFLAKHSAKVYGIEIVKPAILDARRNAELNGIANAEFIVGDAVEALPKLYTQGVRPDAIVIDPPRAGCSSEVLDVMVKMQPKRIVYVSCNPASLARDLALLADGGYQTREIQPVDMFPQTYHVECCVLLQRKHSP